MWNPALKDSNPYNPSPKGVLWPKAVLSRQHLIPGQRATAPGKHLQQEASGIKRVR